VKPRCSIVIPAHNRAGLTRACLDALLANTSVDGGFEVIVVDDASTDSTPQLLSGYGEPVRTVRLDSNCGFASACNAGARAAGSEYLVFLNNDTEVRQGWLGALAAYADAHPEAAVVGAKLLFPNDTVQHAGVVISQDFLARHVYAGFPADHPAVNISRRFQAVTAGCALFRRKAFEEAKGFDEAFRNSLEDADLCLRLGELGHEVHYCHESIVYHLESASREPHSKESERNLRLFRERWEGRARPDDLDYYVADELLRFEYRDLYPLGLEVASELAATAGRGDRPGGLLAWQARQVTDLLRETVRLTAHIAELELGHTAGGDASASPVSKGTPPDAAAQDILRRVDELEGEIFELQQAIARMLDAGLDPSRNGVPAFEPSRQLGYTRLVEQIRAAVEASVPADSTVLVISRGDEYLLDLGGRAAWHFPQNERGAYSGHHPPDSRAAIDQLETLRAKGADYLVIPETATWWLAHYEDFASHLSDRYRELTDAGDPCRVFSLQDATESDELDR
jgi:GT2 family glycosyltransferase